MARRHFKKPDLETFRWMCNRKFGNKSAIAKGLECSMAGLNKWLREDPEFKEAFDEVLEERLDFAESQMLTLIKGIPIYDKEKNLIGWEEKPSEKLIQFLLETKGKDRGYVKQQDLNHSGEFGIIFNLIAPETDNTDDSDSI